MPDSYELDRLDAFPPEADASGDVDLGLLRDTLALTIYERFERHYAARQFVSKLSQTARECYGSAVDAAAEIE